MTSQGQIDSFSPCDKKLDFSLKSEVLFDKKVSYDIELRQYTYCIVRAVFLMQYVLFWLEIDFKIFSSR